LNAYRLIFGENDGLPSLICDVYAGVAVLKLYSGIWFPYLDPIKTAIVAVAKVRAVIIRYARMLTYRLTAENPKEGTCIVGKLEQPEVTFKEHSVLFQCNIVKGHKTGFFLDHRPNRIKVQQLAKGLRVLDVFSYAGGFSVHALVGGAREVTSVDISAQALGLARRNVKLNQNRVRGEHTTIAGDAFKILQELKDSGQRYDLIIIDPPAFAKNAEEVPGALRQYERLARMGASLIANCGTLVLASCSSRIGEAVFFEACERGITNAGKVFSLVQKTFHAVDHPIGFTEGAYLKCGYYSLS